MKRMRLVFSPVSLMVIALIALIYILVQARTNSWIALLVALAAFGAYILQGLRRIPADPPHRGILMFLGKREGGVIDEGWVFLPLYPFAYNVILVRIVKINLDLTGEERQLVRTSDMAEVAISVSAILQPDYKTPGALITFEDSGGESGVMDIITDAIRQELRVWGVDSIRKSWEDVVRARDEAVTALIKAICKKGGRVEPTDAEVEEFKNGPSIFELPGLGTRFIQLFVGEIEPTGELAKAAEKAAKEKRDQKAEQIELAHLRRELAKLRRTGMTHEQALEAFQTERSKVTKTIAESKFTVPAETRQTLENIASGIVDALTSRKEKSDE